MISTFTSTISGIVVECRTGDIAQQHDVEAVVNPANEHLLPGGGVTGAIHAAAGPGLAIACLPLAPIAPGEAVITAGHNLPNQHVIHCLAPLYGRDEPAEELLAACYYNALRLAEQYELTSIAFPALATGAFRYPVAEAAYVAWKTMIGEAPRLISLRSIRFVLDDLSDFRIFQLSLLMFAKQASKPAVLN